MALRKIKLYGKLGQLFGREWNLDINSVAEAIKAIDINTNNKFSQYLLKNGSKKYYKICVKNKKNLISKEEINTSFGNGDIYITPTISGSGKYGQIIAGIALVAISYYAGGFGPNASFFPSLAGKMGIALILGGVAQLLAPNPNAESTDQRNSSLFQGNATTVYQGAAVGLIYGRVLTSPMPVCISTDSLDQNTYNGQIVNIGTTGPIDETLILYSSKGGTATLIGFEEFKDASIPPKKYLVKTFTGSIQYWASYDEICYARYETELYQQGGANIYSSDGSYSYTSWYSKNNIIRGTNLAGVGICGSSEGDIYCLHNTATATYWESIGSYDYEQRCCTTGTPPWYTKTGTASVTLSNEDTELNAIARLMNSSSWSAWQATPIYPYYQSRTSGFSFLYLAVKTKSITLPDKYNPNFSYKYSVTLQRRAYGSSDPWVDAETIETIVTPQSDGTLILPEVELSNVSGYETKVKNASLNYN